MNTNLPTYNDARKAIRGGKDPIAFLHLGILYAEGIGTAQNHVLANYFFDKAALLGCEVVYRYIALEYEHGTRSLAHNIEKAIDSSGRIDSTKLKRFRKIINTIRAKKYYGLLATVSQHFHLLYPEYSEEKAIQDILRERNTLDADLYYSRCTESNKSEIDLESQEQFLQQLYAPVLENKLLLKRICQQNDTDILGTDVYALLRAIANYTHAYNKICETYGIKRRTIMTIDNIDLYPYIKVSTLSLLRQQAIRCLLSIKDVDSMINEEFLNNLDNSDKLLDICEKIGDEVIQLFLISYVELNLDIETIESNYLSLLTSYRNNDLNPLITYLNDFTGRLSKAGIEHHLPQYTSDNLPEIGLS